MMTIRRRSAAPFRVMYVANSSQMGGANRVLTDLVRGLDPRRFDPVIVAPRGGPLAAWARDVGVRTYIVPDGDAAGRAGLARRAAQLVPLIVRTGTTLVHAIDPVCYRAAAVAAAVTGVPRVCHIEFPVGADELEWYFRRAPDVVVTCYERQATDVARALDALGRSCRVVAIPNAVDAAAFAPARDAAAARERWRRGAAHVVAIVGHLSEIKGHPTFVRAAAMIAETLGDCAFLVLGGETVRRGFRAQLEQLAREVGIESRLHFLGWQKHVAEVLAAADVVALPSLVEGLPLAVLEAMACARPVVATAVNGTAEAVVDGVTGLLVRPNDPRELATAILQVLQQPALAARMGAAGRERVLRHYSIGQFLQSVQALYSDVLLNRAPGAWLIANP